jgi:hypothetical protein
MAIKINNNSYSKFYLDGDEVSKIYLNSSLVYTASSGGGDEPEAWEEWEKDLLTFTALEAADIGLFANGMTVPKCYYRKATDTGYTQMTTATTISLGVGEQVKFYGRNAYWSKDRSTWTRFTSTGKFNVSGNVMTLLASGGTASVKQRYCFRRLFAETHVVDASELTLPSTQYDYMFYGTMQQCPYLQKLPVMPTPTHTYVYGYFSNKCPSLQSATLPTGTYDKNYTFQGMFQDCSGLTAVTIPAEAITNASAVALLFQRCTSLHTITFSNMTNLTTNLASDWFDGAYDTIGTAYVPANRTYEDNRLSLPSGWSVQNLPT